MADPKQLEEELRGLVRRWAAKLPVRLQEMDGAESLVRDGRASLPALEELRLRLHRLAGSGSAFGHPQVTSSARSAEYVIKPIVEADRTPTAEETRVLVGHLDALRQACAAAMTTETGRLRRPGKVR